MKRTLLWLLIAVMAVLDCSSAARAEEVRSIHVGDALNVTVAAGQEEYLAFTPDEAGLYVFTSESQIDTYASLYDLDMNELAYNDDGTGHLDFCLAYEFEAGQTCFLGVRCYSSSEGGSMTVSASRSDIRWSLSDDGTLTVSGTGAIPPFNWGMQPWYDAHDKATSLVIGEGITEVGNEAFEDFSFVTDITLPSTLTRIGIYAFEGTGIDHIELPRSLESIEWGAFSNCYKLTAVELPACLSFVTSGTFLGCGLTHIDVSPDNSFLAVVDGVLYTADMDRLLMGVRGLTHIEVDARTSYIEEYAFYGMDDIVSVTLPDGLTGISYYAFALCGGLERIEIPASVTQIDNRAFGGCDSLQEIVVAPGNAAYADRDGILYTADMEQLISCPGAKTNVSVPQGVKYIGASAFQECHSLRRVTLPEGLTAIGWGAFENCTALEAITIPKSVTDIEDWVFEDCTALTDVYYTGSRDEWARISIADDNDSLTGAEIHYDTAPEAEPAAEEETTPEPAAEEETTPVPATEAETTAEPAAETETAAAEAQAEVEAGQEAIDPERLAPFVGKWVLKEVWSGDAQIALEDLGIDPITLTIEASGEATMASWEESKDLFVVETEAGLEMTDGIVSVSCRLEDGRLILEDYPDRVVFERMTADEAQADEDAAAEQAETGNAAAEAIAIIAESVADFAAMAQASADEAALSAQEAGEASAAAAELAAAAGVPDEVRDDVRLMVETASNADAAAQAARTAADSAQAAAQSAAEAATIDDAMACYATAQTAQSNAAAAAGTARTAADMTAAAAASIEETLAALTSGADAPEPTEEPASAAPDAAPDDATGDVPLYAPGEYFTEGDFDCLMGEDGLVTVVMYTGGAEELEIPARLGGAPVGHIDDEAFFACMSLRALTIPEGVETIGHAAFMSCSGLESLALPASLRSIMPDAFRGCPLLTAAAPAGSYAAEWCGQYGIPCSEG